VAQGNGDAYLQGVDNYSISHHLHDIKKKNYLIFGRAGLNSIASVTNLIKIHKLSNQSILTPDLNKPNSVIFFLYEGIDLVWNHSLYINNAKENETVEDFTLKIINRDSNLLFLEKLYNSFPILPFVGAFFEDFLKLFNEIFESKNLKDSISSIFDRIKKLFGFYIVLGDKEKNDLTWVNSLKDHKNIKNIRFETFKFTLEEANKRNLKTIVETGVARGKVKFFFFRKINWKDGMSTLMFSEYSSLYKGQLHTCDIDKSNIEAAKKFCKKYSKFVTFYVENSLNFLKNFKKKIDLLYLDSLDGNIVGAEEHQLNEIKYAENKLHKNSLILLDDKLSKSKLSIEYLKSKNYKILIETDQQILFSEIV